MAKSAGWPVSEEIVETFQARAADPSQAQLDLLTKLLNIPIMALARAADGGDLAIGMIRVVRAKQTFEFSDEETVKPVVAFVVWGRWGEAIDIVGWSPRDNWIGTWLGRAALLNEFELQEPRIDGPLKVFLNVADWLRAHRQGVAIIDKTKVANLLEGLTLQVLCLEDGINLRKILERPRARILVPAAAERVAA